MIVQNVIDGSLEGALAVSYKWLKDRVNIGYRPEVPITIDDVSYVVYSETGLVEKVKNKTKETVSFLRYDDEIYAALLFFN